MIEILLLGAASGLASGVLFRHQRMLTFLAAAGLLWEAQWMLLVLGKRLFFAEGGNVWMVVGAIALLAWWSLWYRKWRLPYMIGPGSGRRDAWAILATAPILGAAFLVMSVNGFNGAEIVWHGYFNGDTATFVSLTQRALLEEGLHIANPFAAGTSLEYPTLLHVSLAELWQTVEIGMDWLHWLPFLTFGQILLTVPAFFLLWDVVYPEPEEKWVKWLGISRRWPILAGEAALVLYMVGISFDGYIYPQSHFFLMGLFIVLGGLLFRNFEERGQERIVSLAAIYMIGIVLMMANAVTGTAAAVLVVTHHILMAADVGRSKKMRLASAGGAVFWVLLFWLAGPRGAGLSLPHFSYEAASFMLWLVPAWLAVAWGALVSVRDNARVYPAALGLLTIIVFWLSDREIVVGNAERFIYHAVLIGMPFVIEPIIRGWYWLKRELIDSSISWWKQSASWIVVGLTLFMGALPALASGGRAMDNLLFQDERVFTLPMREAAWWIRENSSEEAIFLASTEGPWFIPVLTGRIMARADYWLSPKDEKFDRAAAAFGGDKAAQKKALLDVDYLVITQEQLNIWDLKGYATVFNTGTIKILDVREGAVSNY